MKLIACTCAVLATLNTASCANEPWQDEIAALRAEVAELRAMIASSTATPARRALGDSSGMTTVDQLAALASMNTTVVDTLTDHESRIATEEDYTAAQDCIVYTSCS